MSARGLCPICESLAGIARKNLEGAAKSKRKPPKKGRDASFEGVADVLGNSPEIVHKHYAKWSPARETRIDELMIKLHVNAAYTSYTKDVPVQ